MQRVSSPVSSALVFALGLAAASCAHAQTITTFDPPNSNSTFAVAINLSGQIAGTYLDTSMSSFPAQKGFLREPDGTFTTFQPEITINGRVFQLDTRVSDLNLQSEIVGTVQDFGQITTSSFLRNKDGSIVMFRGSRTLAAVPDPATVLNSSIPCEECIDGSGAFAVNAIGQIVGVNGGITYTGYLRQPDGTTTTFSAPSGNLVTFPKAINFFGQITGYSRVPDHGFLRQPNGTFISFDPPNSTFTRPRSINLFSQITGYFRDSNSAEHGFIRQPNGKFIVFDVPGSTGTEPQSINFWGEVTGTYTTDFGSNHGFVREPNGTIQTFDAPGSSGSGTFAKEINDLGVIVGYYMDSNSVVHGFVRTRN